MSWSLERSPPQVASIIATLSLKYGCTERTVTCRCLRDVTAVGNGAVVGACVGTDVHVFAGEFAVFMTLLTFMMSLGPVMSLIMT